MEFTTHERQLAGLTPLLIVCLFVAPIHDAMSATACAAPEDIVLHTACVDVTRCSLYVDVCKLQHVSLPSAAATKAPARALDSSLKGTVLADVRGLFQ